MTFELNVNRAMAKATVLFAALGVCAALVYAVAKVSLQGVFADERIKVSHQVLQSAVGYFPNSARIHARLASSELAYDERDLSRAESHALRAIELSPNDYRFRLTLAAIKEAAGDRPSAEDALRAALALAPNDREVHWRLANVLLRAGKLEESLEEFRIATASNTGLLPSSLDLVWRASNGRVEAVEKVAGSSPKARVTLAQFLLGKSRVPEAVSIFSRLDRNVQINAAETSGFIKKLMDEGHMGQARTLWENIVEGDAERPLVWNSGFESDILKNFAHFDWAINRSDFARIGIDAKTFHNGARSLRVEFAGRDTTRLDKELKQLALVRPGARYRLECFVKTESLATPEGPRIAVIDGASNLIAESEAIAPGTADWQRMAVDFVAPRSDAELVGIYLILKQTPRFSYTQPTQGTIWLDDFTMKEQRGDGGRQQR